MEMKDNCAAFSGRYRATINRRFHAKNPAEDITVEGINWKSSGQSWRPRPALR